MLKKAMVINLEKLGEEPYASVLCYPKPSKAELKSRLKELQRLRVKALEFKGEKQAFNIAVLGKGCVGIVVIVHMDDEKAALKIRRVDADRTEMQHEAEMLEKANSVDVGPKLLRVSKNFLLMQYIDGVLFPVWLEECGEKAQVRKVLRDVLRQCWRLDKIGLDHGELSHAPKHVIINQSGRPFIVDFESASINRKPSNVTSICQFLFISGAVAVKVVEKLGKKDKETIIEPLRKYKKDSSRENFERVLTVCGL